MGPSVALTTAGDDGVNGRQKAGVCCREEVEWRCVSRGMLGSAAGSGRRTTMEESLLLWQREEEYGSGYPCSGFHGSCLFRRHVDM